jgi:hypothetical protein
MSSLIFVVMKIRLIRLTNRKQEILLICTVGNWKWIWGFKSLTRSFACNCYFPLYILHSISAVMSGAVRALKKIRQGKRTEGEGDRGGICPKIKSWWCKDDAVANPSLQCTDTSFEIIKKQIWMFILTFRNNKCGMLLNGLPEFDNEN